MRMRLVFLLPFILVCTAASWPTSATNATGYRDDDENSAYFAFKIQDPKMTERVLRLHEAVLNVSQDFAPFFIDPNNLLQPLISFHIETDELNRIEKLFDAQLGLLVCPYIPRRIPYERFSVASERIVAMLQTFESDNWFDQVYLALRSALDRHGFIVNSSLATELLIIKDPGMWPSRSLKEIDSAFLELRASAYVDRLYICRGRGPNEKPMKLSVLVLTLLAVAESRRGRDRHTTTTTPKPTTTTTVKTTTAPPTTTTTQAPVNDENTAYLAFKIEDAKFAQRVQKLQQAALKVSKDFSPFLVNTTQLYQPLISFHMEDDEKNRTSEIYDRQLELALCSMLPRRIPYTQFKVVDGAMKAMSETGPWLNRTKSALRDALNRQGFIFHSDLDENLVVIMNPLKLNLAKIDLRPLKLAASAEVDSLFICRGRAPSASFSSPCQIVHESFLDGCPSTAVKDATLADLIYAQNARV